MKNWYFAAVLMVSTVYSLSALDVARQELEDVRKGRDFYKQQWNEGLDEQDFWYNSSQILTKRNRLMGDKLKACSGALEATTNVLESTYRCGTFKLDPKDCGITRDNFIHLVDKTRKANYYKP